jgi:PAS domain S-box-containing protein
MSDQGIQIAKPAARERLALDREASLPGALPLRAKVRMVVIQAALITLSALAGAVFILQITAFRNTFANDLGGLAAVMASHAAPALENNDVAALTELLAALRAKPAIVSATIVAPDGTPLARFGREETAQSLAEFQAGRKTSADGKQWLRSEQITRGGQTLGTLHLRADYAAQRDDLIQASVGIVAGFLILSALIIVGLTTRLHGLITQPIAQLAEAARDVARRKDYSVRVPKLVDDELGQLADAFNQMLSEIQEQDRALQIARQSLEAQVGALADSEARFRGVVENLGEALLLVGLRGEALFVNPRFTALFGWTHEDLQGRDAMKLLMPETDRHGPLLARTKPAEAHGGLEIPMQRRDGTWFWAEVHASQMRGPDGQIVGTLAAMLDITSRRRAADELEELNKQLVDTSRQAGMAEVATGVLHNVGNVLNSVNLAASASLEKLRASKVANLTKAAELMGSKNGDLADWLTTDPQGQRLPGYLVRLSEHLAAENQELMADIDQLAKNVEHIKEIVCVQQSYACVSGVIEALPPEQIVEDAVRMNIAKVSRHGIEVARHYTPTPPVAVDKHKVIQILVNLIRNAKHALQDAPGPDKRITIRIGRGHEGFVDIAIVDNGMGIAPESLTRIFQHGFTTKKHGHGFGLHSGALAAKELGGSLTVHSDGPGTGATFTISLPIAATDAA